MIQKTLLKARQRDTAEVSNAILKVNTANSKVNRANAQSRLSGILFAQANGKLYFEFLKIFSVPENLPLQGAKTPPKSVFL